MAKILVSDKLSKDGLDILEASGIPVVMKPGMTEDELCKEIVDYDVQGSVWTTSTSPMPPRRVSSS